MEDSPESFDFGKDMSTTMKRRLDQLRHEPEHLTRLVKACFFGTHVNYRVLMNIIRQNDMFPFGFLLFRPRMTYMMGTGILTVAGASTGETLIGHADFQLTDNVVQKMHYGHFTMYLKSIVKQQKNVYLAENIYAQGYVSGNGIGFHSPDSARSRDGGVDVPSIFSCLVPYDAARHDRQYYMQELPNPLDITGKHSDANPELAAIVAQQKERHYATSEYYRRLHDWNSAINYDREGMYGSSNRWNTLVFQGHQSMYNPSTRTFDLTQSNTGHWGPDVYPGCGRVRKGLQKQLLTMNYNSINGGVSNKVALGV
jgi:hypothetical protein